MSGMERITLFAAVVSYRFFHEFRPLAAVDLQKLLDIQWTPSGVILPRPPLIRMTSGNFPLLDQLLAQFERVLEVNGVSEVALEHVRVFEDADCFGSHLSHRW